MILGIAIMIKIMIIYVSALTGSKDSNALKYICMYIQCFKFRDDNFLSS